MLNALLTPAEFATAAGILLLAYFVRGIAGFGSALVAVPLLTFLLPLHLVVVLIGLLDYLAALSHGIGHRDALAKQDLKPLIPSLLLGVGVALWILRNVEADQLSVYLGLFILLYALWSLAPHGARHGSRWWAVPLGFMGGLVDTAFGTGGPFYVIYFHLRQLNKRAFRATAGVTFAIDGLLRLLGYLLIGLISKDALLLFLLGLPVMALGMWLGGHVHVGISETVFRRLIAVLLLGSGLALIFKA